MKNNRFIKECYIDYKNIFTKNYYYYLYRNNVIRYIKLITLHSNIFIENK